ncbi:phage baseplate assembly protein V [Pseudomonas citri]|uniref:phage baseplate assembly protein V n=1 Tax=Pseudomonas citri TaxID=2978349 RepID=UPI0021B59B7B|nr:phage baseplate assembly protein V [Pseudomonas citri]
MTVSSPPPASSTPTRLEGVVIGVLLDVPEADAPVVGFPGCPGDTGLAARTTTPLSREDIGAQVALMFEAGDPARPLVIGRIQRLPQTAGPVVAHLDGERLEFSAEREIVLRCGKASITLTREGKVLIRGAYLSSRSSGVNRIKGGSVQIN